jgi:integration host factor subunit beta
MDSLGSPAGEWPQRSTFVETVRKDELIARIARRTRLPKSEIRQILDAIVQEIGAVLAQGREVNLYGFGTFGLRHYPPRMGINPQTGEPVAHPERYAPSFRSSTTLRRRIRELM